MYFISCDRLNYCLYLNFIIQKNEERQLGTLYCLEKLIKSALSYSLQCILWRINLVKIVKKWYFYIFEYFGIFDNSVIFLTKIKSTV